MFLLSQHLAWVFCVAAFNLGVALGMFLLNRPAGPVPSGSDRWWVWLVFAVLVLVPAAFVPFACGLHNQDVANDRRR